jgi:hypothetical protein
MEPRLELAGASVIFVGSFNPAIFHPSWFEKEGLLPAREAAHAATEVTIATREIMVFETDWLSVQVTQERCAFSTIQTAQELPLRDLALGTFRVLEHTPIAAMGMNHESHFLLRDREQWDAVGFHFAPQAPWDGILDDPRLRSLTTEIARKEMEGWRRVEVAPSARVEPFGVYVGINDDYHGTEMSALKATELLEREWETNAAEARVISLAVVSVAGA